MTQAKPSKILIAPEKFFIIEDHLNSGSILNKPRKFFIIATHLIKQAPTLVGSWVLSHKRYIDIYTHTHTHRALFQITVPGPHKCAK